MVGLVLKDAYWAVLAVREPGAAIRVIIVQSNRLADYEREMGDARRFFKDHFILSCYEEVSLF